MADALAGSSPTSPSLRCVLCTRRGPDGTVAAVCHHCGVGLCADHVNAGAPGSPEFKHLRIPKQRNAEPAHCPRCAHRLISGAVMVATGAVAVGWFLAVITAAVSYGPQPRVLLSLALTAPAILALAVWGLERDRLEELPCPVLPDVTEESVTETYRYDLALDDGGAYSVTPGIADGVARATLRLGPDDARRIARVRRQRAIPADDPVDITYGFVTTKVVDDGALVGLNSPEHVEGLGAMPLRGTSSDSPYLDDRRGVVPEPPPGALVSTTPDSPVADVAATLPVSALVREFPYRPTAFPLDAGAPIEVVAVLEPKSHRRVVRFHVTWAPPSHPTGESVVRAIDPSRGKPSQILHFEFDAPVALGDPDSNRAFACAEVNTAAGAVRRIRWEGLPLGSALDDPADDDGNALTQPSSNGRTGSASGSARGSSSAGGRGGTQGASGARGDGRSGGSPSGGSRRSGGPRSVRTGASLDDEPKISQSFTIRFENPIAPSTVFVGNVAIEFDGSFAGVEGLRWFDPLGHPVRAEGPTDVSSILDANFSLSMASIAYESTFVRLERSLPGLTSEIRGAKPDHSTAIEVARTLTGADFSIYQITESVFLPPDRQAVLIRSWQLFGRHFRNLTPLEFLVKLEGPDARDDAASTLSAIADVSVSAQAVFDSDDVRDHFRSIAENIEDLTRDALHRCVDFGRDDGPPAVTMPTRAELLPADETDRRGRP